MSSTALSVSVTRSDARFLGSDQLVVDKPHCRGDSVQFFFVSTVEGWADTMIRPALLATARRT